MDLILIFVVISIIANIVGASKKSTRKQKSKSMPKSAASRRRDLLKDFRDLLENKPFADTARQPVIDQSTSTIDESKDRIYTRTISASDRPIYSKDTKYMEEKLQLEPEKTTTISLTDVQRAIVMAEVLGKPKALRR